MNAKQAVAEALKLVLEQKKIDVTQYEKAEKALDNLRGPKVVFFNRAMEGTVRLNGQRGAIDWSKILPLLIELLPIILKLLGV